MLDFGRSHWFDRLDRSRAFLWTEEDAARLRASLKLASGQRIADVGCGWGFLGHLLLPALSPGGQVVGYDLEETLLATGRERAREAGVDRALRFVHGDALDVDDRGFDGAICQTVLLHQSRPEELVAAMAERVRPGGFVAAIEPDLLAASASLQDPFTTPESTARDVAMRGRIFAGVRRMGAGDYRIGGRLAALFAAAGLTVEHSWLNGTVAQCIPGRETPWRSHFALGLQDDEVLAELDSWRAAWALAGGEDGSWRPWVEAQRAAAARRREAIAAGSYWSSQTNALHICVARVPIR